MGKMDWCQTHKNLIFGECGSVGYSFANNNSSFKHASSVISASISVIHVVLPFARNVAWSIRMFLMIYLLY